MKSLLFFLALLQPSTASACIGFRTYDFADPGVWLREEQVKYRYYVGLVSSVTPLKQTGTALVSFEVLKAYHYKLPSERFYAIADLGPCSGGLKVGMIGKFRIVPDQPIPTLHDAEWAQ